MDTPNLGPVMSRPALRAFGAMLFLKMREIAPCGRSACHLDGH